MNIVLKNFFYKNILQKLFPPKNHTIVPSQRFSTVKSNSLSTRERNGKGLSNNRLLGSQTIVCWVAKQVRWFTHPGDFIHKTPSPGNQVKVIVYSTDTQLINDRIMLLIRRGVFLV